VSEKACVFWLVKAVQAMVKRQPLGGASAAAVNGASKQTRWAALSCNGE
jgi:hypothetical protein